LVTIESQSALSLLRGSLADLKTFCGFNETIQRDYGSFEVRKRSGGVRKIYVPPPRLSELQSKIARCLTAAGLPHRASHGFLAGRSIVSNALVHFGAKAALNFDVTGFFDAIVDDDLVDALAKPPLDIPPQVGRWICDVCCLRGSLPTGSPSSPILSDIFMRDVDARYSRLANEWGCQYSRYGDDFTFSTRLEQFPVDLAFALRRPLQGVVVGPSIIQILSNHHLSINGSKTRIERSEAGRLQVTGIRLGARLDVRQQLVKRIEAMLRLIELKGIESCEEHHRKAEKEGSFRARLASTIAFASQVRGAGEARVQTWRNRLFGSPVVDERLFWRDSLRQARRGFANLRPRPVPAHPGEVGFVLSEDGESVISTTLSMRGSKAMIDANLRVSGPCIDHRGALLVGVS